MRKIITIVLAFLLVGTIHVNAQNSEKKTSFKDKITSAAKSAKESLENAGHKFGDAIGFEDRVEPSEDVIRVSGHNYMPIYDVNLDRNADGQTYRNACRSLFKSRYPAVNIMSVAIPQVEWITEPVRRNDNVVGYVETLYCYVLGQDSGDGYINAKFMFKRYKNVGGSYQPLKATWPKWVNTNVLTNKVYDKLLEK